MAFIWDKLTASLNKDIESEKIWEHLETMYNFEALDESESLPFPNDEKEFYLPDSEFGLLKSKKEEKIEERKSTHKGRETPKNVKEPKKEEKTPNRNAKEMQRRDSKDGKETKTPPVVKKEIKKEPEKAKIIKSRNSSSSSKEDSKSNRSTPKEEGSRSAKRPTRGNQKADDSGSSGKASPITVTPSSSKRRRL